MIYKVTFSPEAEADIKSLKHNEPKSYQKLKTLLIELQEHPFTGTGRPKPLRENRSGQWSRRITQKHRLVYRVVEDQISVLVLSAYGHLDDK
jgi:toxin YoeB